MFATKRFGAPLEVGARANIVRIDMMQIEHCSFYISREQAENLHRSFSVIKSSQQRRIFEEYKTKTPDGS
ncbi:TPA: hypothetical protein ACGPF0_002001, partial [Streptococcus suis]